MIASWLYRKWKPFTIGESPPLGFPGGSDGKESTCSARDPGLIPGSRRSPVEGNGNPLQYSCLENPMDRGAWQAIVHGVTKSGTRSVMSPSRTISIWGVLLQSHFSSVGLITYFRTNLTVNILYLSRDRMIRLPCSRSEKCPFGWKYPQIRGATKFWQLFQARWWIPFVSIQIKNWDLHSWIYGVRIGILKLLLSPT